MSIAALFLLAACETNVAPESEPAADGGEAAAVEEPTAEVPEQMARALADAGMTLQDFDALMFEIAQSGELSAAFAAGRK
ncbi:MAG: hypothetical protein KTR31_24485 [Myxococcales bacterium]|nr:hypothetical protein [Myxococcales bacterium]